MITMAVTTTSTGGKTILVEVVGETEEAEAVVVGVAEGGVGAVVEGAEEVKMQTLRV